MKKLFFLLLLLPFLASAQVITQGGKVVTQGGKVLIKGTALNTLAGLKIWHAARLESGTSDGTAKAVLVDYSNNGFSANQATSANQPLYKTSGVGTQPAYLFDGSNDGMSYATLSLFQNIGGATAYLVYKKVTGTANMGLFVATTVGGSSRFSFFTTPTPGTQFATRRLDGEAASTALGGVSDNNAHIVACVANYTGGQMRFFQDGALISVSAMVSSGSTSNTASATMSLGFGGATDNFNGYIAEVIVCNSAHSDAVAFQTMSTLKSLYGL